MRHALLARSLLVVDEVHASDAYMTVLLEKLLQAHLKISFRNTSGMHLQPVAGNPQRKTVYWDTLDVIDDPERIATLAAQAAAQGARVLVVRNTVPAAVATLKALEQLTLAQGGDGLFKVNGLTTPRHE